MTIAEAEASSALRKKARRVTFVCGSEEEEEQRAARGYASRKARKEEHKRRKRLRKQKKMQESEEKKQEENRMQVAFSHLNDPKNENKLVLIYEDGKQDLKDAFDCLLDAAGVDEHDGNIRLRLQAFWNDKKWSYESLVERNRFARLAVRALGNSRRSFMMCFRFEPVPENESSSIASGGKVPPYDPSEDCNEFSFYPDSYSSNDQEKDKENCQPKCSTTSSKSSTISTKSSKGSENATFFPVTDRPRVPQMIVVKKTDGEVKDSAKRLLSDGAEDERSSKRQRTIPSRESQHSAP